MLYDITRALTPATQVYPGDEPFNIWQTCRMAEGAVANVSAVSGTSHAGTHVDLPSHLGYDIEIPLDSFCGVAAVVDPGELPSAPRMLVKSHTALTEDYVARLAGAGVVLVGMEGESIDTPDSETLPNHHALLSRGIAVIENLDLSNTPKGRYELMAFPLKVFGAEATWVRAVLRT